MYFGRTLIISVYGMIFLYAPTYLDKYEVIHQHVVLHAITVSIIPIFLFTFMVFAYLEYHCHSVKRDWNQFEINSKDDYHQRLQNKELDISIEAEMETNVEAMDFTPSGFNIQKSMVNTSRMDTENESAHSNNTDVNRIYSNINAEYNSHDYLKKRPGTNKSH